MERTYTLISVWSKPDPQLLKQSFQAVYACSYHGQDDLQVIKAKTISTVVAMMPMQPSDGDSSTLFFSLKSQDSIHWLLWM